MVSFYIRFVKMKKKNKNTNCDIWWEETSYELVFRFPLPLPPPDIHESGNAAFWYCCCRWQPYTGGWAELTGAVCLFVFEAFLVRDVFSVYRWRSNTTDTHPSFQVGKKTLVVVIIGSFISSWVCAWLFVFNQRPGFQQGACVCACAVALGSQKINTKAYSF